MRLTMVFVLSGAFAVATFNAGAATCTPPDEEIRTLVIKNAQRDSEVPPDVHLTILSETENTRTCTYRFELGTSPPSLPFHITYYLSADKTFLATHLIDLSVKLQDLDADTRATFDGYIMSGRWHSRGNAKATVTLILFYDFECPYCAQIYHSLMELPPESVDWRLAVVDFPLDQHVWAGEIAKLSRCVDQQSSPGFWEFNHFVFLHQVQLRSISSPMAMLAEYAKGLPDVRGDALASCAAAPETAKAVADDKAVGIEHGVRSTPTLFVNGTLVSGFRDMAELRAIVRKLARPHSAE